MNFDAMDTDTVGPTVKITEVGVLREGGFTFADAIARLAQIMSISNCKVWILPSRIPYAGSFWRRFP
jgi:hypothetical protein